VINPGVPIILPGREELDPVEYGSIWLKEGLGWGAADLHQHSTSQILVDLAFGPIIADSLYPGCQ